MNQTSTIAAALLIAFIVFITMRGELSQYLAVIGLGAGANVSATSQALAQLPLVNPSNPSSANPVTLGTIGNVAQGASSLLNTNPFVITN